MPSAAAESAVADALSVAWYRDPAVDRPIPRLSMVDRQVSRAVVSAVWNLSNDGARDAIDPVEPGGSVTPASRREPFVEKAAARSRRSSSNPARLAASTDNSAT